MSIRVRISSHEQGLKLMSLDARTDDTNIYQVVLLREDCENPIRELLSVTDQPVLVERMKERSGYCSHTLLAYIGAVRTLRTWIHTCIITDTGTNRCYVCIDAWIYPCVNPSIPPSLHEIHRYRQAGQTQA